MDPGDVLFGEDRLVTLLQGHHGADPTEILNTVDEALNRHTVAGPPRGRHQHHRPAAIGQVMLPIDRAAWYTGGSSRESAASDEGLSTPLGFRVPSHPLAVRFRPCSLGAERVVRAMALDQREFKTIVLEGPATIYEASALRETLREAMAEGKDLRIDLGESGRWDLAGLQLLVASVKTGQSEGRAVRLLRVPKVCSEIADRSGLADWLRAVSE